MTSSVELAKQVLAADEAVLFGIFGVIARSGYFPPCAFLNEFLLQGHDPCDQDGRLRRWQPFAVSADEYRDLKTWWLSIHSDAIEDDLGADSWDGWVQKILNRYENLDFR